MREKKGEKKEKTEGRRAKGSGDVGRVRAARLAGNYTALVSDGAFNDLSTPESLVPSTVCSSVRIRRSRAARPASETKKSAQPKRGIADRIESDS